jgi:hypothetical protein
LIASSLVASIVVKLGFEFSVCSSTSAHASSEGRSDHPPRTLRSSYTDTVPEIDIIAHFVYVVEIIVSLLTGCINSCETWFRVLNLFVYKRSCL